MLIGFRMRTVPAGSVPATGEKEFLQLVTLKHKKGAYLKAHAHVPKRRVTARLQECLYVKKGRIRLDLYGTDKKCFKRIYLKVGDLYFSLRGGIGIHVLEDAEMLEFKNGPFKEDKVLI